MNLPDRIFAVGGAGKAVTYELLGATWVQEAVLQPRPDPRSLTVTIIDTAEEEENRDFERIHELEEEIQETKDRLREESDGRGRPGEITIEYLPLTRNIQLHDQNDLIGESAVPRIASGKGMSEDNWWLKPEFINENLDFATGVVRKRGLGKGLYYKAYAEDDDVRTSIDLPRRGKVAVIAGLGGGSGSGIFIDLVRDLKQTNRTAEMTLFGILPNDDEGDAETANAHAALSEMEYLSLQGEDIFKDKILVPIDPTGFGGKKANILQSSDALIEFDRAMVYLIATYYNMMDMEDPFADLPSYAPFIIGVPQVVRYNVDEIQDAKSVMSEILTAKQDASEAEADIYAGVDRFLSREWSPEGPEGELHDADRSDLETRLEEIKSLLEFDLFTELEYESVSIYKDIISQAESESEDITEQIEVIGGSIRAGTTDVGGEADQFVDSTDKQLGDVAKNALKRLAQRKDLLYRLRGIDDTQVQNTISYLLALETDTVSPGVRLNQLEAKLEDAQERKERLTADLEETAAELEEQRRKQQDEIDRQVDNWDHAARPIYEEYTECQSIPVESITDDLEVALDEYAREVENADSEELVESLNDAEVRSALNELSDEFESLGISSSDIKRRINSSLKDLQAVRSAFIKMNEEEGTLESLAPWETSSEEEREEAQRNYRMKTNQLEDKEVFTVSRTGDSISIDAEFDGRELVRTVEDEIDHRRQSLLSEARSVLEEEHSSAMDELQRQLEDSASFGDLTMIIEECIEEEVLETEEIQARHDELESDLEAAEKSVERYDGTADLFEELNKPREKLLTAEEEYRDHQTEYEESRDTDVATQDESYDYIKTIQPQNILQIREDTDIGQSKLFDDQTERQRLRGSLEELARKAQDPQYTGLRKRRISDDRARYNEMNLVVGVMSQAIDSIGDVADLEGEFKGAYNLGAGGENYASFPVEAGGNWDVGLGMFIGGIFLDNLRAEVEADGYHTGYKAREGAEDTDILVHHNHKLDEGWYVRRTDVLNMENQNDVRFFLRDEAEIREDLLNDYLETVRFSDTAETDDQVETDTER
ncbi:hypothetical protein EWF95_11300 [Halonotius roseus]|uniref:Tubulin like n=1 Tax=Halonotius roseus TaxID=2511997 RepID=A0A544QLW8_9EURY|nr:hypothetical protein EWF95_11300 [Halonotius roseus]